MRKVIYSASLVALLLAGCSDEEVAKSTEAQPEDKPKVEETVAKEAEPAKPVDDEEALKAATETVEEDGFIKYRGAEWQGEYDNGGLTFNIHGISVTNDLKDAYNVPEIDPGIKGVAVWMTVKNTTKDKIYEAHPNLATLVTSTGEQVQAELLATGDIGGKIYEGVEKEGDIIFVLKNTEDVADIEWIKLIFNAYSEDMENSKEFTVDLKLK